MADVQPLRALHYDQAVAGPLQDLVAPPYDVIDPPAREALQARSPHNVVAIDLPQGDDPYATAAETLRAWMDEGAVVRDDEPAIWALVQDYTAPDGAQADPQGVPRARPRGGLRPGPDPAARAHASWPEGGPAASHARHAREPLADLLAVQRSGRCRVGRAGAAHRRRAVGRGDRRGRDDPPAAPGHRRRRAGRGPRRAGRRRAAHRRRASPLRDRARVRGRDRRRGGSPLRAHVPRRARGRGPHRVPDAPPRPGRRRRRRRRRWPTSCARASSSSRRRSRSWRRPRATGRSSWATSTRTSSSRSASR